MELQACKPTYECEDLNLTRRKFDQLAQEHGFTVMVSADERYELNASYIMPDNRDTRNDFQSFDLHYRKFIRRPSKTGCILTLKSLESKVLTFYLDDLQSAYELLFAIFFTPEKVSYEQICGRKRDKLPRKEFIKTGKQVSEADFWYSFPGIFIKMFFLWITKPIRYFFSRFRRWEYVYTPEGDQFTVTRRYCGGKYKMHTISHVWMM